MSKNIEKLIGKLEKEAEDIVKKFEKRIDEIVERVFPLLEDVSNEDTVLMYDNCASKLKQALTEGKLVVPLSEDEICYIINERYASNNLDWDIEASKSIYDAQFGGNK